MMSTKN